MFLIQLYIQQKKTFGLQILSRCNHCKNWFCSPLNSPELTFSHRFNRLHQANSKHGCTPHLHLTITATCWRWEGFWERFTFTAEARVYLKCEWSRSAPGQPGRHCGRPGVNTRILSFYFSPRTKPPGTMCKSSRGKGLGVFTQTYVVHKWTCA